MIIEKNIPLPEHKPGAGKPNKYPFAEMEIGDSFAVPIPRGKSVSKARTSLHSAALSFTRYNNLNWTFKTGEEVVDRLAYVRIWRVEYRPKSQSKLT